MSAVPVPQLSPEQYLELERASPVKHEYVDGSMYAKAGGSEAHADLAIAIIVALHPFVRARGCKIGNSDFRVRISPQGPFYYPDVSVRCGETKTSDGLKDNLLNPILIIEILSASTEAFDRGDKFIDYRKIDSLREYALVSQKKPQIEVFLRDSNGKWTLTTFSGPDQSCRFESID
ncbi:MAG TPA: Uma2 family endonuclease [Bryobacteraceae bacterium]|nr:Uma2 family endonuclease [Bryobacteraceae bacterium]